jgi:hypothetical protein
MPTQKLTEPTISRLTAPPGKRVDYHDAAYSGLAVRVTGAADQPPARRTWTLTYPPEPRYLMRAATPSTSKTRMRSQSRPMPPIIQPIPPMFCIIGLFSIHSDLTASPQKDHVA